MIETYDGIMSDGYWIMPNKVLFDSKLSDKEKLLYCLISSLCAEKWFCWASNDYLADKIGYSKKNIHRLLQNIFNAWYITIKINKEFGNQRQVFLNSLKYTEDTILKNEDTPILKIEDNNNIIYNNNTSNTEIPKNSLLNIENDTGNLDVCAHVESYEDIQQVIEDDTYRVKNNKLLKCIVKMCELWYQVDKKEKPIRELVEWIKEKAEIYNIKNSDWTIAQWTMLQIFDQWCEYWKSKGKVTNHKNSVMRFMINYNKPYKKK